MVTSTRRISIATGVLFIVATVAVLVAGALLPALAGPDYLTGVGDQSGRMAAAVLAYLLAAGTSVGIAVALYPVLKRTHPALALGAVVFRTIEAAFYTAAVVSLLSVTTLGRQFTTAPAAQRPSIQALSDTVLSARDHANLVAVLAFSVGSFLYSVVFHQSRLVPRWLSGWGMAAAPLIATACLLSLFRDDQVTGYVVLILPVAVWEMVLAVWLLVRGFGPASGGRDVRIASVLPEPRTVASPMTAD